MRRPVSSFAPPEAFIRYSRRVALTRLALVACFVALLAAFTPPRIAFQGVVEFLLYVALLVVSEVAALDRDPVRASRRLAWRSDALMLLLVANACAIAIQIRLYGDPVMRVEATLLATCVLLFAALRMHRGSLSYTVGVAPPAATLIWIALQGSGPLAANHYALATLLFVTAVLVVTWRQQSTDRALNGAMLDLARKNAALAQAVREAEAAGRAKTRLLAVASHEIRTPLNGVLGLTRALLNQKLAARQEELARGVLEAGQQLGRLLDGVLDYTQVDADAAALNPTPVDLRAVARSVLRVWSEHAVGLDVELALDDDDPGQPFEVLVDAARLEQALVTLVSGAIMATPPGGQVRLRLTGEARGAEMLAVRIAVTDDGPVVSQTDQAAMFEAFERTERGRLQGGPGLGMAIAARNLGLMGGGIELTSPAAGSETGAVFTLAFEAPIRMDARSREGRSMGAVRVLAAEDNPANRMVLAALLESEPVWLVFAEDGAQALEAWRSQAFDLILMDANMPGMDGRAAVREIRRTEPPGRHTPIWMLTANAFEEDVANYLADGADGVLRKPIEVAALFDLMATIAEAAGQAPERR